MKKLSIFLSVLVIIAMMISSCSEAFLEKSPQGKTSENVFYNEKGIDALLTGTYALVSGSALWYISWGASIQNWTYGSAASDDAYKGSEVTDQVPINEIERWEVTTTNQYPAEKWRLCIGMGVDRANKTLNVIKKTEEAGTITADVANRYRAETRFLRGFYNFEAWLVFGDYIPILLEDTPDPTQVSNQNAKGAVLAHIISDLKFAWENLPETQGEPGRPTKYAAMALAARAYLQELQYSEAKPLLDNIINSHKYDLMPYFIDNFEIATENNKESIFEIQACVNDVSESLNAEMGIGLNFPHGGDIGFCCGFHQPSQNLVNAFKVDANGLPLFDTFNDVDLKNDAGIASDAPFTIATDPVDPRLDFTVGRRGIPCKDWGINRGSNWIRKQSEGGPYLTALKPFFNKKELYSLSTTTGWQTGVNANNFRYIRYSHVLLWRAEIAAFEGDLATAREYINMIRERAGKKVVMGKVLIDVLPVNVYPWGPNTTDADYKVSNSTIDWSQPAANYNIGLYPAFASKEEAMRAAQWEQRLEFATEGRRFFDLRRWDDLPAGMRVDMAATLNAFAAGDLRIREFMRGAVFSNKDKFMPVPQTQIDLQPGVLVQNPDYQ